MNSWRNWYAPPAGSHWLDGEGNEPVPGARRFSSAADAKSAAAEDAAALGSSVIYLGAFQGHPLAPCETCNGYGWHPADGGSYPCPDCAQDNSPTRAKRPTKADGT